MVTSHVGLTLHWTAEKGTLVLVPFCVIVTCGSVVVVVSNKAASIGLLIRSPAECHRRKAHIIACDIGGI